MPARLFLSSGDLMADRRFDFARDLQLKGDLVAAADLLVAGHRTRAGFRLGLVHARRNPRTARRARGGDRGVSQGARRRSRGPPRRQPAADAARRRDSCPTCRRPMCARCSINMRRNSRRRWSTISAIAAPRCCSRRCWPRAPRCASRPSSSAPSISAAAPGLAATAFAKEVDHFIGIDLSPRMIERARATGLYARARSRRHGGGLARQAGRQRRPRSRRRRDGLCRRSRAACWRRRSACWRRAACWRSRSKPMAATASCIGEGLRYAHGAAYVRASVEAAGLELSQLESLLGPQRGQCAGARAGRGRDQRRECPGVHANDERGIASQSRNFAIAEPAGM